MNPLTDKLMKLEQLEQSATHGPWQAGRPDMTSYDGDTGFAFKNVYLPDEGEKQVEIKCRTLRVHEDAQLIAMLRNLAPELIALWKAAKAYHSYWLSSSVRGSRQCVRRARKEG